MLLAFIDKLLHCTSLRSNEEWLTGHTVVVGDRTAVGADLIEPSARALEGVAAVLSVVTVVAADAVGRREIALVAQVFLNR